MKPLSIRRMPLHRQRGAVLIVALIVLVALALAALSLLRSVDVLGLVAGNLSFQRSSLNATDVGMTNAVAKLRAVANLTASSADSCYSAVVATTDTERGIPTVLDNTTTFKSTYRNCFTTLSTNEVAYFYIDRQCNAAGVADSKRCLLGERYSVGNDVRDNAGATVVPTYRITVRVDGSRNAVSYVQMLVRR